MSYGKYEYTPLPRHIESRHDIDPDSQIPKTNIMIHYICAFYHRFCQWIFPERCVRIIAWILNIRNRHGAGHSKRTNEYENEMIELQTLKERLDKRVEEYARENERLKEENQELIKRIKELENNLEASKKDNSRLYNQVRDLQKSYSVLAKSYEQEKEEKEKALTRLSSVAGERLRFNNPAIADLSDENRPNKLAEKFSELYDNEWTEFYENMEGTGTEEEIIGQIVQLLKDAFDICNKLAQNQRQVLTTAIAYPANPKPQKTDNPPEGVVSKVIDFQKRTASLAFQDVEKIILEESTHLKNNSSKAKGQFVEKCSQLCWMMAIQDPPMFLNFGPQKDSVIDKNVFRLYTKTGEKVDFLVWPAVFLHEDGPIVQKGVLQPK
ncbi:uncharacterized protein LOC128193129 isoform X1 [Crassostrea angulata]|uniref:uncharacterized protein LOC128193129 isoform X1 n=1 Tax=Magallana angulata TaxID=2784310 RepID=UPI0022B17414|nr:uncharacterized protein LOC128193129 isoform X1 [Crassostrea angulata]